MSSHRPTRITSGNATGTDGRVRRASSGVMRAICAVPFQLGGENKVQTNSRDRSGRYCFAGFTLDMETGLLRCGDEQVPLRPKSFEVLAYMVERHGRLISRQELISVLWRDVAVT